MRWKGARLGCGEGRRLKHNEVRKGWVLNGGGSRTEREGGRITEEGTWWGSGWVGIEGGRGERGRLAGMDLRHLVSRNRSEPLAFWGHPLTLGEMPWGPGARPSPYTSKGLCCCQGPAQ